MSEGLELRWPGKYVDGQRAPLVDHGAELRERERLGPDAASTDNQLICGDNLLALEALVRDAPESVDLVYIDPPFATGNRFALSRRIGDKKAGTEAELRLPAFDDAWTGGIAGFLAMLDPRLRLIHRLLKPTGSLYVHVDPTVGHAVKLMLDELFGPACFQREIIWRIGWISGFKTRARNWIRNHDTIFFYTKHPREFVFNKMWVPHPKGYERREGRAAKAPGVAIDDVWNAGTSELELSGRESLDSIQIKSFSREKTGWATQKNESLLRRIIAASSEAGAVVADVFAGSGTTAKVAAELGRRFVVCDHADAAVQICRQRLLAAGASLQVLELDARERVHALERLAAELGQAGRESSVAETLETWLLEQLGAEPEATIEAPFAGRRGEVGLAIALPGQPVDDARRESLCQAARAQGLASVELVAFDWDALPEAEHAQRSSAAPEIELVELAVGRSIFDAATRARPWVEGGVAIHERARLVLDSRPHAEADALELTVVDLAFARPEHAPEAVQGSASKPRTFADRLLGWAVYDADAPTEPLFVTARSSAREPLELRARVARREQFLIACEDICGHRHCWRWSPLSSA